MHDFTLLMFGWNDEVLDVQPLQTPDALTAHNTAEALIETYPGAAGWQLWYAGRKVLATFPQVRDRHPLRLVGQRATA
jgi:hypothetical protein